MSEKRCPCGTCIHWHFTWNFGKRRMGNCGAVKATKAVLDVVDMDEDDDDECAYWEKREVKP